MLTEPKTFAVISRAANFAPPGLVSDVPFNCALQPRIKALLRPPVNFTLDLVRVDRVAEIMTRAVGHKANGFTV